MSDWREKARCREAPLTAGRDPFFLPDVSGRGRHVTNQSGKAARWYCDRCTVAADCLAYALRTGVRHGIWAGLDAAELVRMRQEVAG